MLGKHKFLPITGSVLETMANLAQQCPWACIIITTDEGLHAFEKYHDYQMWSERLIAKAA